MQATNITRELDTKMVVDLVEKEDGSPNGIDVIVSPSNVALLLSIDSVSNLYDRHVNSFLEFG